jgi:hypothetical protein
MTEAEKQEIVKKFAILDAVISKVSMAFADATQLGNAIDQVKIAIEKVKIEKSEVKPVASAEA